MQETKKISNFTSSKYIKYAKVDEANAQQNNYNYFACKNDIAIQIAAVPSIVIFKMLKVICFRAAHWNFGTAINTDSQNITEIGRLFLITALTA